MIPDHPIDTEALRRLADAATDGPWEADHSEEDNSSIKEVGGEWWDGLAYTGSPSDAEFIAAARTAVPALLDALAAAEHRATRAEAQSETRRINTEYWRETALQERAAALDALKQIKVRDARIKAARGLHQQSALIRYVPRSMRAGHDDDQPFHYCTGCDGARYPCDTIRALDGDA